MEPSETPKRKLRVGHTIEDWCRPCRSFRAHTVTLAGPDGEPQRVSCDTCASQHNFRGHAPRPSSAPAPPPETRSSAPMSQDDTRGASSSELESLLRRILREESGMSPVAPAEKWRGGELVLRPGKPGLQEKTMPIETLFQKIVAVRNRLRVLEQQINATELPTDVKLKLHSYITGCYGSLTSFNVLFASDEDRFRGSAGKSSS